MPAEGPVSLTRQTIYCFIPIMDLYAAYHIKKLGWYLFIMIGIGVALIVIDESINPTDFSDMQTPYGEDGEIDWIHLFFGTDPQLTIMTMMVEMAVTYIIAVFVIRRWSKEWNEQFESR